MKIAQIVCTFPPYNGGMGNVAYEFGKGLSNRGHSVSVFTPFYSSIKQEKINDTIQVFRLKPLFTFGNASVLSSVSKYLKNFDVIHLHYPFYGTAFFVYKFKKKNPNKKLIITYHMDAVADGLKGFVFKLYSKILMPKILKSADIVTVSSFDYIQNSEAKKIFKKYPDKFVELPFGVDLNHFKSKEKDRELMNKLNIEDVDKVILFVGGLDSAHYFKGLELLIKAVSSLRGRTHLKGFDPSLTSIKIIIVGQGDLKQHYQKIVDKMGLGDSVKFVGSVSYQDLPKYYNLADLFVLPSINKAEAFGLVLLEAMACGKAVIASDLSGVRTVPADKERSIFKVNDEKDLINKIKILLEDDNLRESIGVKEREKVFQKYNWENLFAKLSNIIDQI